MRNTIAFLIVFMISLIVRGQSVIDNGDFFNISEKSKLESQIEKINKSTSIFILLYTTDTLNGKSPKEYGMELGHKFQPGEKGINNGIIILLSKKDGKLQLLNGYGLEWVLPDDESKIITNEMVQYFRKKEFYQGIEVALKIIGEKVSKYDWNVKETKHGWISKDDEGKIVKFVYSNKTGNTSFKYLIETDPQFNDSYFLPIEVNDNKYQLFYSKYMNDFVSKILNRNEVIIYARLKDWNNKRLELLGIE
jgi:uncharacterized protein